MVNYRAIGLKVLFMALGIAMVVTLVYTISVDGPPFRKGVLNPWLPATMIDFYATAAIFAAWVIYKESNWISATLWIFLLICFGSIATCTYVVIQLSKLSPQASAQDPIYHVLLRNPNENNVEQTTKHVPVVTARVFFAALGCLMLGIEAYTALTYWPLLIEGLTSPWGIAILINYTVNIFAIAVWIAYKETSIVGAVLWIVLLFIISSFATCAYIIKHLSRLASQDPLYLVLFRNGDRAEERYQSATLLS